MLRAAYDVTQNDRFLTLQRKAFDWFLGQNDLRIPVYDFRTKGCNDGLTPDGVNTNQGAESTLSFLLGLLAVIESYAFIDKTRASNSTSSPPRDVPIQLARHTDGKLAQKARPVKSIPAKAKDKESPVEELI